MPSLAMDWIFKIVQIELCVYSVIEKSSIIRVAVKDEWVVYVASPAINSQLRLLLEKFSKKSPKRRELTDVIS